MKRRNTWTAPNNSMYRWFDLDVHGELGWNRLNIELLPVAREVAYLD
jgi:hypothetical protein